MYSAFIQINRRIACYTLDTPQDHRREDPREMSNWTSPREALPAHCTRCDRAYNPNTGPCPRCTIAAPAPAPIEFDALAEFVETSPSRHQLAGMFVHLHQTGRLDAVLDQLPRAGQLAALAIVEGSLAA